MLRVLLLLALLPALSGFGPPAVLESSAARQPVSEPALRSLAASTSPNVQSKGAALVDQTTGDRLWGKNADQRLAIASTTKVMTALLALEGGKLDQPVRVRIGAADLPGSSVAGLRAGDQLPLGEMLYGLMLPSGNDAALAIAEAVGGSVDGFVDRMNRRAGELGLRETHFVNPHGLDDPNHHSSAADLARLTRLALERPEIVRVVGAKEHTSRGRFLYQWTNTNRMLWLRPDATGVKTGTTDAAGDALVASARRGERAAVVVVLGSPDRWAEASALLDHFFGAYRLVQSPQPSPFTRGATPKLQTVPAWQAQFRRD